MTVTMRVWMSWDHCMRLLPMLKTKSLLTKSLRVPKRPRILIMKSLKVYTEVDKLQTMISKLLMIFWKETWSLTLMESLLNKNWQRQQILWNQKTFCCLKNSILRRRETSRMNNSLFKKKMQMQVLISLLQIKRTITNNCNLRLRMSSMNQM